MQKKNLMLAFLVCAMTLSIGSACAFAENVAIATDGAPAAVGSYSQGIVVTLGVGTKELSSAGQIGIDPKTNKLVANTITAQTERVMKNIQAILKAAGMGFENVTYVSVSLNKISDFKEFDLVYKNYFKKNPPARETVGGLDIPKGALVEVSVRAIK